MNQQEQAKEMQKIIAKAWTDEGFKKRLIAGPNAALEAEGVEIPEGVEVRMVENTDKVFHLVLPAKPSKGELSDDQLDKVAGGGWSCDMTGI